MVLGWQDIRVISNILPDHRRHLETDMTSIANAQTLDAPATQFPIPAGVFAEKVVSVKHYTDSLFAFRITRPASFRFRSGEFVMIGLPNAVPDILAGMRLSLTVALILAVVGELLTAQEGLGTAVLHAARSYRAADLYAGILLLGLIGLVSNYCLAIADKRILAWKN